MSHITIAVSKNVFKKLFFTFRDNLKYPIETDPLIINGPVGSITITLSGEAKLENGNFELLKDRIRVSELDIAFNRLIMKIDLNLNKICVGGGCALPNPFDDDGCAIPNPIPETCIFDNNPDVSLEIDLAPFVRAELSLDGIFEQTYVQGTPNKWIVTILPDIPDIDLIDISDVVAGLLENQLIKAIKDLIPGSGQIEDLILQIMGGLNRFIRKALDAPDDLIEWLKQTLLTKFQLFKHILEYIEEKWDQNFHEKFFKIDDPSVMIKRNEVEWEDGTKVELPPVLLPIKNLKFEVNQDEMIITTDVSS